jgi:transposase-like protein
MEIKCPYCCPYPHESSEIRSVIKKAGSFYRKSDRKKVQRFFCKLCASDFSQSSRSLFCYQKKRHLNPRVKKLLAAGVSQRETARIVQMNRKTIARKLVFLGKRALKDLQAKNRAHHPSLVIQFDDMETFEHTKCKPLSITLAVEEKTRRILGFEVSQMPAKGHLAAPSRKKYGPRRDLRPQARKKLFEKIKPFIHKRALIKSDENPHYPADVRKHFPNSKHMTFKGRKGAVVGQGELKKIGFDPLFSLNHTCATLRERVNTLKRRTWSTTKKPERLKLHIALVAAHHNHRLKKMQLKGPV